MKKANVTLYVGTKKGAWIFRGDGARKKWKVEGPHLIGQQVNHVIPDPRDSKTVLMAAKPGHLGPTGRGAAASKAVTSSRPRARRSASTVARAACSRAR